MDPETQRMISLANAERAIRRLYRAGDSLPTYDRFPFSDPMEDVLTRTVSAQKRWIKSTEAFLIKALRRIKSQERKKIAPSRSFSVRISHLELVVGKLVGFISLHVFSQFPFERCRSSQAHPFSFTILSFQQPGTA